MSALLAFKALCQHVSYLQSINIHGSYVGNRQDAPKRSILPPEATSSTTSS
jgi:hypothetical protein